MTRGELDVVDFTKEARRLVSQSGVVAGLVQFFVAGSTAGLTTIEFEPGAVSDLKETFSRLVPRESEYAHNAAWGDGNGHSHVRAAMLGADLTVPVRGADLVLGTWQQVVLVEFDTRSRNREIHLTVLGEGALTEGGCED